MSWVAKAPSIAELRADLRYDPATGFLHDRKTRRRRLATRTKCGRLVGRWRGVPYYAHRIAWALHYGTWPEGEIDHINGDASDNRIVNLRDVDRAANRRNTKLHKNNESGTSGVCWSKQAGRWQAQIKVDWHMHYLGYFDRLEDAVAARQAAERRFGFHPHHGRVSPLPRVFD